MLKSNWINRLTKSPLNYDVFETWFYRRWGWNNSAGSKSATLRGMFGWCAICDAGRRDRFSRALGRKALRSSSRMAWSPVKILVWPAIRARMKASVGIFGSKSRVIVRWRPLKARFVTYKVHTPSDIFHIFSAKVSRNTTIILLCLTNTCTFFNVGKSKNILNLLKMGNAFLS